jgi:initiation factor 1A
MVKNSKGGKKAKKHKNHAPTDERILLLKDLEQEYGLVTKVLGCKRFTISCFDGSSYIGIARKKRVKILLDSLVIISKRDFEKTIVDIIYKYNDNEAKKLEILKEIPSGSAKVTEKGDIVEEEDSCFVFEDI